MSITPMTIERKVAGKLAPYVVEPLGGGRVRVSSRSKPGVWHIVTDGQCDCIGQRVFLRRECNHTGAAADAAREAARIAALAPNACIHVGCGHPWASHGDGVAALCWRCSDEGREDYRHACVTPRDLATEAQYRARKAAREEMAAA